MSMHSYTRCWLHLIWSTSKRQAYFDTHSAVLVSRFLHNHASGYGILMPINYVNPDHVHCLIDLPTFMTISKVMNLLKGGSSHWINQHRIVPEHFSWGRGYAAFSVCRSHVKIVMAYIANQEEHHRRAKDHGE